MNELTARQIQILRWLHENPSHKASWTIDGRELRTKDKFENTNVMVISGINGSIHVHKDDNIALCDYIVGCPTPDKIFGPNDRGRAILAAEGR